MFKSTIRKALPRKLINLIKPLYLSLSNKHNRELNFWKKQWKKEGRNFENGHYQRLLLGMAEEKNDNFLKGKIVADFGSGPRGSLKWIGSTSVKIGIDVLAARYADDFKSNIITHNMIYVKATESSIPIASNTIDVLFTLNAMDHVDNFRDMCAEVIRIIKPGGLFIGSFNLEEPPGPTEPQQLNEEKIQEDLLSKMEIISYRVTHKGPDGNPYLPFFDGNLKYTKGQEGFLWVKARKK